MEFYLNVTELKRRYGTAGTQARVRMALDKIADDYPLWKHGDKPHPIKDSCGEVIGWVNPR